MEDYTITIRADKSDRDLWLDFSTKCKKEKKKNWAVLSRLIKEYLKQ